MVTTGDNLSGTAPLEGCPPYTAFHVEARSELSLEAGTVRICVRRSVLPAYLARRRRRAARRLSPPTAIAASPDGSGTVEITALSNPHMLR